MNNEEKILEMLTQMQEAQKQMQGDLTEVKADLIHIKARLDLDVDKRLDALAEGQSAIVEKLSVLDEVKELAEDTRDKVDVIHAVVAQLSKSITELKKAK